MNEQLAALKGLWTKDEASYHGEHVSFAPTFAWPKPVRRPHPPIFVGGESKAALDRLLRHGDAWLPRARTSAQRIREVRQWLADNGRTVPVTVFGARDVEQLDDFAAAGVERVTFMLPTMPESTSLVELDRLAGMARAYRR
jgi:alkanesulfonate monooxygenase SsuD/methylene tetrahydromethanopterin reductase-like flavin-dependent oxidoreductase (luciferase family)